MSNCLQSKSSKGLEPIVITSKRQSKRCLASEDLSRRSFKSIHMMDQVILGKGPLVDIGFCLLKLAALEIVRRFSRAKCPFVWHGLQALQLFCYPPLKWIQRWDPFRGVVRCMQTLSRPMLVLSIATTFYDSVYSKETSKSSDDLDNDNHSHAEPQSEPPASQSTSESRLSDVVPENSASEKWLLQLHEELDKQGLTLPERINVDELRRFYTAANGEFSTLLSSIKKTIRWRQSYTLLPPQELEAWSHLVFWHGHDARRQPCLMIRLGLACSGLTSNNKPGFAQAVVSQVEYGVLHLVDAENSQITVLMDCENLSPFRFPMQMMRSIAVLLQDHYPNRLGCLFVVRLPPVARVIIQTLTQAPATGSSNPPLDVPLDPLSSIDLDPGRAAAGVADLASAWPTPRRQIPKPYFIPRKDIRSSETEDTDSPAGGDDKIPSSCPGVVEVEDDDEGDAINVGDDSSKGGSEESACDVSVEDDEEISRGQSATETAEAEVRRMEEAREAKEKVDLAQTKMFRQQWRDQRAEQTRLEAGEGSSRGGDGVNQAKAGLGDAKDLQRACGDSPPSVGVRTDESLVGGDGLVGMVDDRADRIRQEELGEEPPSSPGQVEAGRKRRRAEREADEAATGADFDVPPTAKKTSVYVPLAEQAPPLTAEREFESQPEVGTSREVELTVAPVPPFHWRGIDLPEPIGSSLRRILDLHGDIFADVPEVSPFFLYAIAESLTHAGLLLSNLTPLTFTETDSKTVESLLAGVRVFKVRLGWLDGRLSTIGCMADAIRAQIEIRRLEGVIANAQVDHDNARAALAAAEATLMIPVSDLFDQSC